MVATEPVTEPVTGTELVTGEKPATGESQPPENKIQEAVDVAARVAEETGGLGRPGRPLDRRSPFFIGMMAAAGVAVTYGVVELLIRARGVLVLIGLALFVAAGLDPAVSWLARHRLPRWTAAPVVAHRGPGRGRSLRGRRHPAGLTSQATLLASPPASQ